MKSILLGMTLLMTACVVAPLQAAQPDQDEWQFLAPLQLGDAPSVHYLDASGHAMNYQAFAQQLAEGKHYSSTRDTQAHAAVLRITGTTAGYRAVRLAFGRGDAFPPFELRDLKGDTQRLSAMRGKYTLVSFFFAQCAPCIAEVPTLNAYARQHGDMNVLAITYEDADTARGFVKDRAFNWPVLHDGQALIDVLGVSIYPTIMLIGPDGRLLGTAVGLTMRDDQAKRLADLTSWVEEWKKPLAGGTSR